MLEHEKCWKTELLEKRIQESGYRYFSNLSGHDFSFLVIQQFVDAVCLTWEADGFDFDRYKIACSIADRIQDEVF